VPRPYRLEISFHLVQTDLNPSQAKLHVLPVLLAHRGRNVARFTMVMFIAALTGFDVCLFTFHENSRLENQPTSSAEDKAADSGGIE
jgi:hypothetical protein